MPRRQLNIGMSYLLAIVLLWHAGREALLLNWYQLANASFTELFCMNKDKPAMACHGHCQLMRLSAEWEEQDNPAGERPVLQPEARSWFVPPPARSLVVSLRSAVQARYDWPRNVCFYQFSYTGFVFHPPATAVG